MAKHNPLVVVSGQTRALSAGDTVNGATSLPKYTFLVTNNQGSTINKCQAVYIDATDSVKLASSNNSVLQQFAGFVYDDTSGNGNTVNIQYASTLTANTAQWDAVSGGTGGLTPGSVYYLSGSTAGSISTTPPAGTGKYVLPVGVSLNTTTMGIYNTRSVLLASGLSITAFPAWDTDNEDNWATIAQAIADRLSYFSEAQELNTVNINNGANSWHGATLAPNGFIYCTPYNASMILKVDPTDNSYSSVGSLGSNASQWSGAALASNGYIYCVPMYSANVLKIDTSNDTTSKIGSLGTGGDKWHGCVMARNGMLYGIPCSATTILKINTSNDSVSTFGSGTVPAGAYKYLGGSLAPNDCIYIPPFSTANILKIDTSNDYVSLIGDPTGTYAGAITAPNGCVYGVPLTGNNVLKIDPSDDSISYISFTGDAGESDWINGTLAPNGHIYCFPYDATTILDIDTNTDTASVFGTIAAGTGKYWGGGAVSLNGVIYVPPADGTTLMLLIGTGNTTEPDFALSRFFNKS